MAHVVWHWEMWGSHKEKTSFYSEQKYAPKLSKNMQFCADIDIYIAKTEDEILIM